MATLAENVQRIFEGEKVLGKLPVIAADIIYEGAAVGISSGYMRPLVAADPFYGFAERKADNSLGLAGKVDVELKEKGIVVIDVVGVTGVTDKGSTVYASDDDTFTLTSTSNTPIGKVVRYISGTKVAVAFEGIQHRSL